MNHLFSTFKSTEVKENQFQIYFSFQGGCHPQRRRSHTDLRQRPKHTGPRSKSPPSSFGSALSNLFLPFSFFPSNRNHPSRKYSFHSPSRQGGGPPSQRVNTAARKKRKNNTKFAHKIQTVSQSEEPKAVTFSCKNRPPGYYADVSSGCQVT